MKKHPMLKSAVFGVLLAIAGGAQVQAQASFDCAKGATKVEKMICQSPDLARLDSNMSAMYKPGAGKWYVRLHAAWLAQRNKCADAACLAAAYAAHTDKLESLNFLDWDNELAYVGVLDIARDQATVTRGQQAWRKLLDQCVELACVERTYAERDVALKALLKSVPRAAMKKYTNKALGIGFEYLENRSVEPCAAAACVRLTGVATSDGSPEILEIHVQDGSLMEVAGSLWQRRGDKWMASGRFSESEVAQYSGAWKGLQASTECSFSDRNGMHAAGECNTYLLSNGKRAIVITDTAVSGKDPASEATIDSVHFLR
jgi:uncharacterized protein